MINEQDEPIRTEYTKTEFAQMYYNLIQDLKTARSYALADQMIKQPSIFVNYFLKEIPLDGLIVH